MAEFQPERLSRTAEWWVAETAESCGPASSGRIQAHSRLLLEPRTTPGRIGRMVGRIVRGLDWFVPEGAGGLFGRVDARWRSRVLVGTCFTGALVTLPTTAALSHQGSSSWLVTGACHLALLACPFLLRWTRSVRLVAWNLMGFGAALLGLMMLVDGVSDIEMVLGLVLPILAVLLLGARAGIVLGVVVTAIVTAAFAVDALGMHPSGTAHSGAGYRASMTLSFGWVALACILGYEHQRVALQARLQQALQRLSESATQDPLTRVSNRRYLARRLAAELAHAVRHGDDFGVIILDLDHFKRINDTHGHEAGDHVLVEVARRIRASLREEDVLARYGGEEFVVLTRGGLTGLRRLAERLRVVVACEPISTPSEEICVTFSAGCATWRASAASTADGLLRTVDECLYAAKAQGRNCVVAVDDPEAPASTCSPVWLTRVSKGAGLAGLDGERTVEGEPIG